MRKRTTAPAGDYDQRIEIQVRAAGANNGGEPTGAWTRVALVWAKIEPLRGASFFAAAQLQERVDCKISFRYGVAVDAQQHRALHLARQQPFEILAVVEPSYAKADVELMCATGVRDGR